MIIEVKELCEVDYINITDMETNEPIYSIRTIEYESDRNTLLKAFDDYQNNFDVDNVVCCEDEFEGSCLDTVEVLSVKEIQCENNEEFRDYMKHIQHMLDKEEWSDNKDRINRMLTIAYNAITLGQLDEKYNKEELLEELGCTEEEYDEIMEG